MQATIFLLAAFFPDFWIRKQGTAFPKLLVHWAGGDCIMCIYALTKTTTRTAVWEKAACEASSVPPKKAGKHRHGETSLHSTLRHAVVFLQSEGTLLSQAWQTQNPSGLGRGGEKSSHNWARTNTSVTKTLKIIYLLQRFYSSVMYLD